MRLPRKIAGLLMAAGMAAGITTVAVPAHADPNYFVIETTTYLDTGGVPLWRSLACWPLPPGMWVNPFPQRLEAVRAELARSRYHGSAQASDLAAEIEDFSRATIVGTLSALPG